MMRNLFIAVIIALFTFYGVAPLLLPHSLSVTAPADQFSAMRAMQHVAVIGRQIHPAGSPGMADVTAYLMGSLEMLALDPEIQEAEVQQENSIIKLHNVVVRIPGLDSKRAILFLAHSDSTPFGPGAGDNSTGAAVLLEVARALRFGPALQNDIILLFDDGEEYGYLGGYAFARDHPWMEDIHLVVGLDTAAWGPTILLETTPGNGGIIQEYAMSVQSPVAFCFIADITSNIIHDDSEILPFMEKGLPGLDLEDPTAFSGKHTGSDTFDEVNPASIQQMGNQVLALARQFGSMDLNQKYSEDESYFTLWGLGVVHYPARINIMLVVLSGLSYPVLIILGIKRKLFNSKGMVIGSLASLGIVILVAIISISFGGLFKVWFPNPNQHITSYLVPASTPFLILILFLTVSLYFAGRGWLTQKLGTVNMAYTGLAPWLVMELIFIGLLPIGSYLFISPLILAVVVWSGLIIGRIDIASLFGRTMLALSAIVATVLVPPNLILCFLGAGIVILPLLTVLVVIVLGLWAPVLN